MKPGSQLPTIAQVMRELGVSREVVESAIEQGDLRIVKFGKRRRIPRAELDRLLAARA
jgi:excisionase family DNA binding protein